MGRGDEKGFAAVARLAGVSTATVSNTLNRPHLVAEPTRERVLAALDELDIAPNRAAATLRQGWNRLIGLVIPDIVNPFYATVVDAIVDAADRERYAVALCVSHEDPARERRHMDLLAEQRAAGALVVPVEADHDRLDHLRRWGTRLVLVDRVIPASEGCSVAVDDVEGGRLAAEHLLAGGARGITVVNGRATIPQCADRSRGARTAAAAHSASIVELECAEMTIAAGVTAADRILAEGLPRDVVCANDQLAVGVIRGLAAQGVSVPGGARVVGYGDLALSDDEARTLTTVGQPQVDLGRVAVELLLDELRDGQGHQHTTTVLPPRLIVRASSGA